VGRRGKRTVMVALGACALFTGAAVAPAASAATGHVTEFPTPTSSSHPTAITAGPDGNLWFTENSSNAVGRVTPAGLSKEFPLTTPASGPKGIATGSDGNLWATEFSASKIARVTSAGTVAEFPTKTAASQPDGIAAGPDSALWFAESAASMIGRVTTAGTVSEFGVTAGSVPDSITAGPDGNLWFTEMNAGKIGRITTGGTVHEFPVPTSASAPVDITAGPDGALWFVESAAGKIGRSTTAGQVTEFNVPTSGSGPHALTAGPDGALWFTELGGNKIGRITTVGAFTEFPVPTAASQPAAIATGPDGNVWFTELQAAKIGRLQDAQANTAYIIDAGSGFSPRARTVAQGVNVQWDFTGPASSTVADTSGLGLFGSGTRSFVTYYTSKLSAAGTYGYDDALKPAHTGNIAVPERATPAGGTTSTQFTVTFASAAPTAPLVIDAQLAFCASLPCTPSFVSWTVAGGTSQASHVFSSSDAQYQGAGHYFFRSRLRNSSTSKMSGFSPAASISIHVPTAITINFGGCANGGGEFCFVPELASGQTGVQVTWTNQSTAPHTLATCDPTNCPGAPASTGPDTFNNVAINSTNGSTGSFTFTHAGTYYYYCTIHGYTNMNGRLAISAGSAAYTAHQLKGLEEGL